MVSKIIFGLSLSILTISISYASLIINYQHYGYVIDNNTFEYPVKQYGIFFQLNQDHLPKKILNPLAVPRLSCKIKFIQNNQEYIKYIKKTIEPSPLDDKYTYFTPLDFSKIINVDNNKKEGYITEDKNTYLKGDTKCRIIYGSENFDSDTSNIINIPKKDIINTIR